MAFVVKKRTNKPCVFCKDPDKYIDYKELSLLEQYMSHRGKILPRRLTGVCAKHQRKLNNAIKIARNLALLPYTTDKIRKA
ncbi:MAG TPA: 30S ribosomal protein S18 [bacterium]|nr:30S ribosomal protein S18 [bacterium]